MAGLLGSPGRRQAGDSLSWAEPRWAGLCLAFKIARERKCTSCGCLLLPACLLLLLLVVVAVEVPFIPVGCDVAWRGLAPWLGYLDWSGLGWSNLGWGVMGCKIHCGAGGSARRCWLPPTAAAAPVGGDCGGAAVSGGGAGAAVCGAVVLEPSGATSLSARLTFTCALKLWQRLHRSPLRNRWLCDGPHHSNSKLLV